MKVYAAFDLHSRSSHLAVLDEQGEKLLNKKLSNDAENMILALEPYRQKLQAVAVESTFNWYWLVDALMESGYPVRLANPAAIQKYSGLKHSDDASDARWLAEMLRLDILPQGYIYPREHRPVRDLLRKRMHLAKLRTSMINSLSNIIARNAGVSLKADKIKQTTCDNVSPLLAGDDDLALSGWVSKDTIDYLTRQIKTVEKVVVSKIKLRPEYKLLLTMPGVGIVLCLTIMLETGPIDRFPHVGNYASYCRKVPTRWTSAGKGKGRGNKKNGNKYLSWAFSEAAEIGRRHDPKLKAYYDRKAARTNTTVAHSALAHKLCRAAYHIMRDQVPFEVNKLFG